MIVAELMGKLVHTITSPALDTKVDAPRPKSIKELHSELTGGSAPIVNPSALDIKVDAEVGATNASAAEVTPSETIERAAIEEIQSELTRLCYARIPLVNSHMHRVEYLSLCQGKAIPMRVQCNGETVAKVYDPEVGYVLEFGMGVGE